MEDKNYFLAKWLNKEITDEELQKFVSEEEIRAYKRIVQATEGLKTSAINEDEVLEKVLKSKQPKVRKLYNFKHIYRVAAVIALVFATYWFTSSKSEVYTTEIAEKINFELPDNSIVELNAASNIDFNTKDWKNNRTLNLNGEAYFKVEKGSKFSVKTSNGTVQVLGTQFNVISRDNLFEVVCYEGLVSVLYKKKEVKLPLGNSLKIINNEEFLVSNLPETKPSWITNNSTFKSLPYEFVVNEFERQYNVQIEYPKDLKNELFTGNFNHSDLESAIKAISIPMNLTYIINQNNVTLTRE